MGARRSLFPARLRLTLGAVAAGLLMVVALEGVLRLFGLGAPDPSRTTLAYQRIDPPLLRPAERPDGTPVFATVDPRLPYRALSRAKGADELRVFVLGGSAAAGLGFSPNVTFARHLERICAELLPERRVAVVNLGIVAISSRQVRQAAEDVCARYEPDLLVVYSGNNEFLEPHAEKYARATRGPVARARAALGETHLFRLLSGARPEPPARDLAEHDAAQRELRLTQREIVRAIEMDAGEVDRVVDEYERNLDAVARTARDAGVPLLLLSVASNWEWRGREDLDPDWTAELIGGRAAAPEDWESVVAELDARLAAASDKERHEWLFRRAVAHERLARFDRARADYRAAMNADPHLRRALDRMNERVRAVAERRGASHLDTVALLSSHARHGIVGFAEFYDYVHMTPRAAVLVAGGIAEKLQDAGILPRDGDGVVDAYVEAALAALELLEEDPWEVGEWLGVGPDLARIRDRDLWKYDKLLDDLDGILAADPDDVAALVYRGNAAFFRPDGAADAARDYRRALELSGGDARVRANLELLLRDRAP